MSGPTYSPDGRHIWNGSEWITAPPTNPTPASEVNNPSYRDSVHQQTGDVVGGAKIDQLIIQSSTPVSVIETNSISKEIIFFGLFIIFLCYQIGTIALAIPLVAMVLFLKERPIHPKFPIMGKFTSIFAGLWDIYTNPHFKKTLDDKGNYRTSLSLKHSFSRLPLIGRFVKRDGVLEAYSDAITAEKEAKNAFFSYCTISIMLIIIIEAIILQRYPPFLGIGTANLLSQGNADVSAILVLTNLIRTLILYCYMGYCLLYLFLLVFRKEAMRKL